MVGSVVKQTTPLSLVEHARERGEVRRRYKHLISFVRCIKRKQSRSYKSPNQSVIEGENTTLTSVSTGVYSTHVYWEAVKQAT